MCFTLGFQVLKQVSSYSKGTDSSDHCTNTLTLENRVIQALMSRDDTIKGNFWEDRRVLVAGGAGFIGSHLVDRLVKAGSNVKVVDSLENGSAPNLPSGKIGFLQGDLLEPRICKVACEDVDIVYNVAARVAGVGYNVEHPAEMFYRNAMISLNMLEAARTRDVSQFVVVSSACVYERDPPVPTPEGHGFVGDPEPTNLGYGWAKRFAEVQARVYAAEYGMKISIVRPYNAYGPRDHFDPSKAHVIPSLIHKIFSGLNELAVWGNGHQKRSFVYVSDVVEGLILAAERYPVPDPINIGSNEEVSIAELVEMIMKIGAKRLRVKFDESKPVGQSRRSPDLQKARRLLGYSPEVSLHEGLSRTIEWYLSYVQDGSSLGGKT
jgi:nucleoside-diphosphate-sugar epimerase